MSNLILSKESSESQIKRYFNAVLELSKSDNQFPVNLDEVWPLVYTRRDSAIDALKRDFIENDDFITVRNQPEGGKLVSESTGASWGGNNKLDYMLTVSCLEYFIVKKVRPVFEVYRQVFHKTANNSLPTSRKRSTGLTTKVKASLMWIEGVSRYLNLNDASKLGLLKQVAEPLGLPTPDYTPSKGILKSASALLKENGSSMSAQQFNAKLIEKGYLKEITRLSSKGGTKKFKSITDKGTSFGENQVNPNNPKETQPLYYEDKFAELLQIIKIA